MDRRHEKLVRPGLGSPSAEWHFAELQGDLTAEGSTTAKLYDAPDDAPASAPELGETIVTVYDFLLNAGEQLDEGTVVRLDLHPGYARWYVTAAKGV